MSSHSSSHRLRTGRHSCQGQIYLITATTLDRAPVFADWVVGRMLVQEMRHAHEQSLVSSMAWVVMPDHFHWLLALEEGSLPRLVQQVKSKTAIVVNKMRGREGALWQRGFHDKAIRREQDLIHYARYIVANPVRAGLVPSIRQYPLWDAIWI